jgi:UPF0271 protein
LITAPELAAKQVIQIVERGTVTAVDGTEVPISAETICIHGDNPGAVPIATAVAKAIGLR